VRALEAELEEANEMCMSAYGSTASDVLAENTRLAAEHTQVHEVNAGLLRDLAALKGRCESLALYEEAARHHQATAERERDALRADLDALKAERGVLASELYLRALDDLAALKGRTCCECAWALRHAGSGEWLCNLIEKPCFVVNNTCGAWAGKEGADGNHL